jgi:hypothetical protein
MGNLPRSRPQRRSGRRAATAKSSPATKRKSTPARSGSKATAGSRARSSSAASRRPSKPVARRRTGETATAAAARKRAPGTPALVLDAALGAAKLPLKLTASATREATKLIGRGIRRS